LKIEQGNFLFKNQGYSLPRVRLRTLLSTQNVQKLMPQNNAVVVLHTACFLGHGFYPLKSMACIKDGTLGTNLSTEIVGNYIPIHSHAAMQDSASAMPSFCARTNFP
jgi:hypothetical protein